MGAPDEAPPRLELRKREGEQTEVEVRFLPEGARTRVELEHRGWERLVESAAEVRDNYDSGWDFVLGKYVARI